MNWTELPLAEWGDIGGNEEDQGRAGGKKEPGANEGTLDVPEFSSGTRMTKVQASLLYAMYYIT